jgi:two-component system chemotaxis sensor kinase CheA
MLEMKVFTANDGVAAMNFLKSGEPIDLILLDIMMPQMDGYEMLRLLRKDVEFKDIPVIAVTAKAMKGDDEKCMAAGASDYVPKPINLKSFIGKMAKWL